LQPLSYTTLEQIVASSVHGVLLVELQGVVARIRYVNPAYESLSGFSARELVGNAWSSQFAEGSVGGAQDELKNIMSSGTAGTQRLACLRKDGEIWHSDICVSRVGGVGKEAPLILVQHLVVEGTENANVSMALMHRNIGKLRAENSTLPLGGAGAGLASVDQFVALLGRDLAIARRNQRAVTLILLEIAEFDIYRATFGQLAADACFRMIGTQIVRTFGRASDVSARLDATSFLVSIQDQNLAEAKDLVQIVAQKTTGLGLHNPRGKVSKHISLRSAIVESDTNVDSATQLIERAREALEGGSTATSMGSSAG
jgi:diguanylate cyclase (GGDEF)-like protein/PAS domain S-box-containing protein